MAFSVTDYQFNYFLQVVLENKENLKNDKYGKRIIHNILYQYQIDKDV